MPQAADHGVGWSQRTAVLVMERWVTAHRALPRLGAVGQNGIWSGPIGERLLLRPQGISEACATPAPRPKVSSSLHFQGLPRGAAVAKRLRPLPSLLGKDCGASSLHQAPCLALGIPDE